MGYGHSSDNGGYDNAANVRRAMERLYGKSRDRRAHDSDQAIHIWAHQSAPWGMNKKATHWFDGPVLYSYQTPIARIVGDVALMTSRKYSVTTSGQLRRASWACRNVREVMHVDNVMASSDDEHRRNIADFTERATKLVASISRSGSPRSAWALAEGLLRSAEDYALAFLGSEAAAKLYSDRKQLTADLAPVIRARSAVVDMRRGLAELKAAAAGKRIGRRSGGMALNPTQRYFMLKEAVREVAAIRRAARREGAVTGWPKGVPDASRLISLSREFRSAHAAHAASERQRRQAEIEAAAEKVEAWRQGSAVSGSWPYLMPGALLRISADWANVETSRGASIPTSHAKRIWPLIRDARKHGKPAHFADVRIGHFRLDSIGYDGSIHAGCHFIEYGELERMAVALGLMDCEAA